MDCPGTNASLHNPACLSSEAFDYQAACNRFGEQGLAPDNSSRRVIDCIARRG